MAIVIASNELEEVELTGNEAIKRRENRLTIAEQTAEAYLISRRKKTEAVKLKVRKHSKKSLVKRQ